MRKSNNQSIKEVISEIFQDYKLNGKLNEVKLRIAWESLMGNAISRRTHSLTLKDGLLFIKITSAPLSEELHYAADKIKMMLNKEFGEDCIKEVKII